MSPGVAAFLKLAAMGYRPNLEGEVIRLRHEGPGRPDPGIVKILVAQIREYKSEVIAYLAREPEEPKRVLTCFECGHFRPSANSPNPTQAWGHCGKRNKGRFGVAMGCEAVLYSETGDR